jgi:hypothetical protein
MSEKKIQDWTPNQLAKYLIDHPEARIRLDYDRLKEMYPGVDFPNRQQEADDGD